MLRVRLRGELALAQLEQQQRRVLGPHPLDGDGREHEVDVSRRMEAEALRRLGLDPEGHLRGDEDLELARLGQELVDEPGQG